MRIDSHMFFQVIPMPSKAMASLPLVSAFMAEYNKNIGIRETSLGCLRHLEGNDNIAIISPWLYLQHRSEIDRDLRAEMQLDVGTNESVSLGTSWLPRVIEAPLHMHVLSKEVGRNNTMPGGMLKLPLTRSYFPIPGCMATSDIHQTGQKTRERVREVIHVEAQKRLSYLHAALYTTLLLRMEELNIGKPLVNPKKRRLSADSTEKDVAQTITKKPIAQLLKPTMHVEARLLSSSTSTSLRNAICDWLRGNYDTIAVKHNIAGFERDQRLHEVSAIEITDYTGPKNTSGFYRLPELELDIQMYTLHAEQDNTDACHTPEQDSDSELPAFRTFKLPNVILNDAWNSLVYDDALPSRLLRYMVWSYTQPAASDASLTAQLQTRMISMMKQPGLNIVTFNWNRLCLLHGPPGSGKSTLCRALAQKLSIRLGDTFSATTLIEINTNALLSKYFGESGKLISSTFSHIRHLAHDPTTLICVIIDEVETITSRREKSNSGGECNDSLRATNQLLTALDRLRIMPNVLVLCTSNLLPALDAAFLDRVDIKQFIPCPSPPAIYRILRSCLNELVHSKLVLPSGTPDAMHAIPTYAEMCIRYAPHAKSLPQRVSVVAHKCVGLSGRTLRRLPILALAMYTWGGPSSLKDAVAALEIAVEQELAGRAANEAGAHDPEHSR
nr:pachytene checkpoint protein 2 like [Quercus suber]